jgi:hypothetical protein
MRLPPVRWIVVLAVGAAALESGCTTMQNAAQKDPMKCERDPKCEKKRMRAFDCSTQCNDDPACMDRCEQVQQATPSGKLGH